MNFPYIPKELVNTICDFYGKIKYRKGEYVNIIHKHDTRYTIIEPIIKKKQEIMKNIELSSKGFYFDFHFDANVDIGLCYDYHFSWHDTFEICYFDFRNELIQIRTLI